MNAIFRPLFLLLFACGSLALAGPGDVESGYDPNCTGSNGEVRAIALQPDGKSIIGGAFTTVGGTARNFVARINVDGTLDPTFNIGAAPAGLVSGIGIQADGRVLVCGLFSSFAGQTRGRIVRLSSTGALEDATAFKVGTGANNYCWGMAIQPDGKILLGGEFTSFNGISRGGLVRLNPDGSPESTETFNPGTGANGTVYAVTVQPDGKILIGGGFTTVNGQPRAGIARLNADGTLEDLSAFNPGSGVNGVSCIVLQPDGKILISGYFTTVNGQARNRFARLNSDGSLESTATFNSSGTNSNVMRMDLQTNGKILAVGSFTNFGGGSRWSIARLNSNGGIDGSMNTSGTGGESRFSTLVLQADGRMLVGGTFTHLYTTSRHAMVRLGNDAATQSLSAPSGSRVQWLRSGAGPEVSQVTFDLSTDGGNAWIPLGGGTRITGGWECAGLLLPKTGIIRARSRPVSSDPGFIQQTATYVDNATVAPVLQSPVLETRVSHALAVNYSLPETALSGSVKLNFNDGSNGRALVLTTSGESTGTHAFNFDPADPMASGVFAAAEALPEGYYDVHLSYQDAAGNPAVSTPAAGGVLIDRSAPVISPPSPVAEAGNAAGAVVNFEVAATDLYDRAPIVSSVPPSGSVFPIGETTVQVTARDWLGNTSTDSFVVTVRDTTPPMVEGAFAPLAITTGPPGDVPLPDYLPQAQTSDAVGVVSVTQSPAPGAARVAGKTTVTITAADAAGNTNSFSFDVTVNDGTRPEIAVPAGGFAGLTVPADVEGNTLLPDYTAQAATSDNVGVTAVTQLPLPGSIHRPGLVPIVLTAHDAAGNTRDLEIAALVVDVTSPIVTGTFTPLSIDTGPDGTVPLPGYLDQAATSDGVGVTGFVQDPPAGSPRVAGVTQVTLTARDAAGNEGITSFEVTVNDKTKPGITAPEGGFTPAELVAAEDGMVALPDYTGQAVTSDNVAVTAVTQVPPPGDVRLFGETVVTLTAHDAAGNTRETSFAVVVKLDGPVVNALAATGTLVPGAGEDPRLPADARFTAFGLPAIDDRRAVCFLARWKAGRVPGSGIFLGNPATLFVAVGDAAPDLSGVIFKTLQDPLLSPGGTVAFGATVKGLGIKTSGDQGVWMTLAGVPTLVLLEGRQIAGLPTGFILKSVLGLSLRDDALLVTARLAPVKGVVTAASDTVLLRVTADGAALLLREQQAIDLGDGFDSSKVSTISALLPSAGSPGQGRWQADHTATVRATFSNGRQVALCLDPDGTVTRSIGNGQALTNIVDSAVFSAIHLPALEPGGQISVVRGTLASLQVPGIPPVVTRKNDAIVAVSPEPASGYASFAREGSPAPGAENALFATFSDPLVNGGGKVALVATVSGKGVTPQNNTGIWWGSPDDLQLLARSNGVAPGPDGQPTLARWDKLHSSALPSGPDAGPVFLARLRGKGITARNNLGLWAVDSTGLLRQLLRTGDLLDGAAITGIHTLSGVTGALGASRGFNERGTITARVQLVKGAQAILRIDVPEGKTRIVPGPSDPPVDSDEAAR